LILNISSPTHAYLDQSSPEELDILRRQLTYTLTSVQHLIKRHHQNHFWKQRNKESWDSHLEGLKADLKKCLVFEDEQGLYIRPGSIPYLTGLNIEVKNSIVYPKPKKMPWFREPKFTLYPYQEESWKSLLAEKHGHVSLCTGAGKTKTIVKLCRETGFRTAIVAPSKSIFYELIEEFSHYFGKSRIGTFGDSKKKLDKQFTICISDSLCNVKEGTPEWDFFSSLESIHIDESHQWAADSMEKVCHGLFANVGYRWFYSGTQVRGDGGQTLLDSIIGKQVHELTTEDAVKGGFICPHRFNIVEMESTDPNFQSQNALDLKRAHVLRNGNICAFIAKLCNGVVSMKNEQVLVLVEELLQISDLVKLLKVPYVIAHSETNKERLLSLGLEKVDVSESIEKFNKGEAKVLVGTSTVRTGCNLFPVNHCVNWVAGASEVATRQGAVGRSVRHAHQNPWASKCGPKPFATIWDFDVLDQYVMGSHLESRLEYYKESGEGLIRYVRLKKS